MEYTLDELRETNVLTASIKANLEAIEKLLPVDPDQDLASVAKDAAELLHSLEAIEEHLPVELDLDEALRDAGTLMARLEQIEERG